MVDLRNVKCPMNFIKAKLAISNNPEEEMFKILLDDNESIDNVPTSLDEEGHEIITEKFNKDHWELIIKKNT